LGVCRREVNGAVVGAAELAAPGERRVNVLAVDFVDFAAEAVDVELLLPFFTPKPTRCPS